jgi:hypothetical protein
MSNMGSSDAGEGTFFQRRPDVDDDDGSMKRITQGSEAYRQSNRTNGLEESTDSFAVIRVGV